MLTDDEARKAFAILHRLFHYDHRLHRWWISDNDFQKHKLIRFFQATNVQPDTDSTPDEPSAAESTRIASTDLPGDPDIASTAPAAPLPPTLPPA